MWFSVLQTLVRMELFLSVCVLYEWCGMKPRTHNERISTSLKLACPPPLPPRNPRPGETAWVPQVRSPSYTIYISCSSFSWVPTLNLATPPRISTRMYIYINSLLKIDGYFTKVIFSGNHSKLQKLKVKVRLYKKKNNGKVT